MQSASRRCRGEAQLEIPRHGNRSLPGWGAMKFTIGTPRLLQQATLSRFIAGISGPKIRRPGRAGLHEPLVIRAGTVMMSGPDAQVPPNGV
jgi:hypothetical protein